MIIERQTITFDEPWRFALVPQVPTIFEQKSREKTKVFEIQGSDVRCLRSFHEEVAGDFFFASHYNCDPNAPLTYLESPVKEEQVVIVWHDAELMADNEPDDWEAVLCMFRAAMATLHPQGTYLRLLFPTNNPTFLSQTLREALTDSAQIAGVGYDESHDWEAEALLH